ncbi:cryptochrome DASH-like protein [Cladochytrium replicatum]|nr:cryptochrome DASH-like protein [Cladochytrium replicatum]
MIKIALCLLRYELRWHDNPVLHQAFNDPRASHVLPVFCFDPRQYDLSRIPPELIGRSAKWDSPKTWNFGFPKCARHRRNLIYECVEDLQRTLRGKGSALCVRFGKPEIELPDLVKTLQSSDSAVVGVYMSKELTYEEVRVEELLASRLKKDSSSVVLSFVHGTNHLLNPMALPFRLSDLPDVYTQFRKRVEGAGDLEKLIPSPLPEIKIKPLPNQVKCEDISLFKKYLTEDHDGDSRTAFPMSGCETTGLKRLAYYLWESDCAQKYKETRNGLLGADYSTKFSPFLAIGSLSPRKIVQELWRYERERFGRSSTDSWSTGKRDHDAVGGPLENTYWIWFELLWREYFRLVAAKFVNQIFMPEGIAPGAKGNHGRWQVNKQLAEHWTNGTTGVPFVDANMRELNETGFMSNRGRQNVASFLTKDLGIDWRYGAEYFESQLIDHDVCSNYGNWLYSAGVGNDPRQDRHFNIIKQAKDYDPDGKYVKAWCPELSSTSSNFVHTPWLLGKPSQYVGLIMKPLESWGRASKSSSGNDRGSKNGGGSGQSRSNSAKMVHPSELQTGGRTGRTRRQSTGRLQTDWISKKEQPN